MSNTNTVLWGYFFAERGMPYDLQGLFSSKEEAIAAVEGAIAGVAGWWRVPDTEPRAYWVHPYNYTARVSEIELGRLRDERDSDRADVRERIYSWFNEETHGDTHSPERSL
jgi:hypothetical protein